MPRDCVVKNRHVVTDEDQSQRLGAEFVDQIVKKRWLGKERREVRGLSVSCLTMRAGHEIAMEGAMTNKNFVTLARRAMLVMAEIKAATDDFDRGDANVFDALDAIRLAIEAYTTNEEGRREVA